MGARWTLGGLVILAGIGGGWYMGANHISAQTGARAAGQAAGQVWSDMGSLVQRMTGHQTAAVRNARDQKATVADKSGGSPGGTTGTARETPVASAPITTANAPPLTPTVFDGYHFRYNPFEPSDGPYPVLGKNERVWIDVSIDQQLIYILNGAKVIYTMITSTGLDTNPGNSTPLGVFHIQDYRGTWFYTDQYNMGAKYWVSWKGDGIFLFHSVPMNENKQLLPKIAAELGHKASHGCFHLTIPDAKWVYETIPLGTTVVVEQAPVRLQAGRLYGPSPDQKAAETESEATSSQSA